MDRPDSGTLKFRMPTASASSVSSDGGTAERPAKRARLATSGTEPAPSRRDGHVVRGEIKMTGSTVHIGDLYQPVQQPPHADTTETDKANKTLIKSLLFDGINARMRNVKKALLTTCEWLISHHMFQEWYKSCDTPQHNGILWIKGKPGCGKSTLIKTALEWVHGQPRRAKMKRMIAHYFFNARATTSLEKSCLGLYRSLVYQLVSTHSSVRELFLDTFAVKTQTDLVAVWTVEELRNFLLDVVTLPGPTEMFFFIDALDEGEDESHIRQMLSFLEDLSERAMAAQPLCRLRVFLTSRHYPHITVENALSFNVEDQKEHAQDIDLYVSKKLKCLETMQRGTLCDELQHKSSGIFLWVELVVEILNEVYDHGGLLSDMRARLNDIPGDLNDLFKDILTKGSDSLDSSVTLFQWALFSMRPLSANELHLAIQYTHASSGHIVAPISEVSNLSDQYLRKYILNCSRGLVELTSQTPLVVQFIHESVREFLTGEDGLTFLRPSLSPNLVGLSHEALRNACQHYLMAETVPEQFMRFQTQGYRSYSDYTRLRERLLSQRPFINYSIKFLFEHAEKAERAGVSQSQFLKSKTNHKGFWNGKDRIWWNILERYGTKKYDDHTTLLHFAASHGYPHLIRVLMQLADVVNVRGGRYGTALHAASTCGNQEAVQSLLDGGASIDLKDPKLEPILVTAIRNKNFTLVPMLQERGATFNSAQLQKTMLTMIARGYTEGFELLLKLGARLFPPGDGMCDSLCQALSSKRSVITKIHLQHLIDHGCPQSVQNIAVIAASTFGLEEPLEALLRNGNVTDLTHIYKPKGYPNSAGRSALGSASRGNFHRVMEILLNAGANVESDPSMPLVVAAADGHFKTVQLLLKAGADVDGRDYYGAIPLQNAARKGRSAVVEILLEAGADVNAQGGIHGNALQAAVASVRTTDALGLLPILLEAGANVNAQGGRYGTALQAAANRGNVQAVQALLEAGADVNVQCGYFGTALQAAACAGYVQAVQCLLEAGADVNAQGGEYGNALQAAARWGNSDEVRILLEAGADVNARGGRFGSALNAVREREKKPPGETYISGRVRRLLLDAGATEEEAQSIEPEYDISDEGWSSTSE